MYVCIHANEYDDDDDDDDENEGGAAPDPIGEGGALQDTSGLR